MRQRRSIRKRDTIRSKHQRSADSIRTGTGLVSRETEREIERDSIPKLQVNVLQKWTVSCI